MLYILLLTIPLLAALVSYVVMRSHRGLQGVAIGCLALESVLASFLIYQVVTFGTYHSWQYFSLDALGAFMLGLTMVSALASMWYAHQYLMVEQQAGIIGPRRLRQYYALFHLFLFALFLATGTRNLLLMWIAIEATTLSTAFLISFYGRPLAIEAAWKYLLLNSIGLLFGLLGTFLFLASVTHWAWPLELPEILPHPTVIKVAFVFILVGYGTKVGLVPMHTWKPDTYANAPIPMVALLSTALMNVAFMALIRYKVLTDSIIGSSFTTHILIFFGITSLIVAAAMVVIQQNYKRLLAYSSIEHAGLVALGLAFGGVGAAAALLHLLYHTFAKSLLFLTVGTFFLKYRSALIRDVQGALTALPATSVLFLLGMVAISGLPPFGLFLTELTILMTGFTQHPIVVIVVIGLLAVLFAGFFRHVSAILFRQTSPLAPADNLDGRMVVSQVALFIMLLVTSFMIPTWLHTLIQKALTISSL